MFRSLCILIAFLIAAKEVVAFGSAFSKSKVDAYENVDYVSVEFWLCEGEDSTERDYEDADADSDSLLPSPNSKAHFRLLASIEANNKFTISVCPLRIGQLFISLQNMRL